MIYFFDNESPLAASVLTNHLDRSNIKDMYAISFDFNTKCLKENYGLHQADFELSVTDRKYMGDEIVEIISGDTGNDEDEIVKKAYTGAYYHIKRYLEGKQFERLQGSVYVYRGNKKIREYMVFDYLLEFSKANPWFSKCAKDVRIFQILDDTDDDVLEFIKSKL